MDTRTCTHCRSVNIGSAIACITCGVPLDRAVLASSSLPAAPPIATTVAVADAPSMPPAPSHLRADMAWTSGAATTPAPSTARPTPAVVGAIVVGLVALLAAGLFMLHRGDGLPDSIAGLQRLETAEAETFEQTLSATEFSGITFRGAMYGTNGQPQLIVELFEGVPDYVMDGPLDDFFGGAAGGFANGSGGSVDLSSRMSETRDGVQYVCASFQGGIAPIPGAPSGGALCVWSGEDLGLIVSIRSADPRAALDDAQLTHEAVH
jgi:hypothetical protein